MTLEDEELPNISLTSQERRTINKNKRMISIILTSARSLLPKLNSLLGYINELDAAITLITETWLKINVKSKNLEINLNEGHGLGIINKPRPQKSDGKTINGGGVAIIFDRSKISLKPYPVKMRQAHKIVAATGKMPGVKRKIAVICAYPPPKSLARSYNSAFRTITGTIQSLKKNLNEQVIILGGDFNNFKIRPHVESFEDVKVIDSGPTCNGSAFDLIAMNVQDYKTTVRQPIQVDLAGKNYDRNVLHFEADLYEKTDFKKRVIYRHKFNKEGVELFGQKIVAVDWVDISRNVPENVDDQVKTMNSVLEWITNECFKKRKITIKSTDPPWFNKYV